MKFVRFSQMIISGRKQINITENSLKNNNVKRRKILNNNYSDFLDLPYHCKETTTTKKESFIYLLSYLLSLIIFFVLRLIRALF